MFDCNFSMLDLKMQIMGKVKIYLKLIGGILYYRDSETDHGVTITTSVDPGDTVIWKKDVNSGIKDLKSLTVSDPGFFEYPPKKTILSSWKSIVKASTGQVTYAVETVPPHTGAVVKSAVGNNASQMNDPDPPIIRVKP
jgi:hypothetical protein